MRVLAGAVCVVLTLPFYAVAATPDGAARKSTKHGARRLAFVRGFWVSKPACVPVTVKSAGTQRTVHIGAGKACPGQSPPPTA
jgi:hypothetical protein